MSQSKHSGTWCPVEFKKSSAKLAIETAQAISKTAKDLEIVKSSASAYFSCLIYSGGATTFPSDILYRIPLYFLINPAG